MSSKSTERLTDRRTVLKGAGTLGLAGAVGVGGMTLFGGSVAADSHFEFDLADAGAVDSPDGSIAWVATGIQGVLSWENHSRDVGSFDWRDRIAVEASTGDGWFGIGTYTIYEATDRDFGPFGRDEDSAEAAGTDGHITFHVADPDGQGHHYTGGERQTSSRSDVSGPTWTIVQDQEFREANDASELDYSVPDAVDPGYGLPQEPVPAEDLPTGQDGESVRLRFTMEKRAVMYDEQGDPLFTETGEGQFELDLNNLEPTQSFTGEGQTDAGAGEE